MPLLLQPVAAGALAVAAMTKKSASTSGAVFDMTRVSRPTTNVVWCRTTPPATFQRAPPVQLTSPSTPGRTPPRVADDGGPRPCGAGALAFVQPNRARYA